MRVSRDICQDPAFQSSREVYKAVIVDLHKQGLGNVDHKPPISEADLHKLHNSDHDTFDEDTPVGLLWKVWFYIMFYICRRGRENIREMSKSTFEMATDGNGRRYIYQKIGELDKNHRENSDHNSTTGEGRIYDWPGNPKCPVLCFEKYLSKLHPNCNALWQRPLDKVQSTDSVWYYKAPLGKNTLSNMMAGISKSANLSRVYTNHCIRTTCITLLDELGIESRHIMRITGHRNESSIHSYSSRLNETKKQQISDSLSMAINMTNAIVPVANSAPHTVTAPSTPFPAPCHQLGLLPSSTIPSFSLTSNVTQPTASITTSSSMKSKTMVQMSPSLFSEDSHDDEMFSSINLSSTNDQLPSQPLALSPLSNSQFQNALDTVVYSQEHSSTKNISTKNIHKSPRLFSFDNCSVNINYYGQ